MRLFACTDHPGFWPVGVASIVVAEDEQQATDLLLAALEARRLRVASFTLTEIDLTTPSAIILCDGDY